MSNTGFKCIHEYNSTEKGYGFEVIVSWNGALHSKRFPVSKYHSLARALGAAVRWRNAREAAIGKPRSERWLRCYGHAGRARPWVRTPAGDIRPVEEQDRSPIPLSARKR